MLAIYKKELNDFFSSLIGYVAIIFYLVITGFFVWIYPGDNILQNGHADLNKLFELGPLVLLFLAPAITMKSFAEEFNLGTIEFLLTKPISDLQIILGKFFACFTIVIIAVLPTLVYVYSIWELGMPKGNIDLGATITSFIGLILLGGVFISIGLFSSLMTKNTILAFIVGLFISYFFYRGFSDLSNLPFIYGKYDHFVESLGIHSHFIAIQKGVIESRDLLYFISLSIIFLAISKLFMNKRQW